MRSEASKPILCSMIRLTREVRFAINRDQNPSSQAHNGFGGAPAVQGWAIYYTLRVTLEGSLDPASSYIENIKQIDDRVRSLAIPLFQPFTVNDPPTLPDLLRTIHDRLQNAWAGKQLVQIDLLTSPYQTLTYRSSEPQMIRLSQKFEFSAAHRLHNPQLDDNTNRATFGKCNNPHGHGHNYEVQVTIAGVPDPSGVLIAVPQLEALVNRHAIDLLDHKFLNVEVEAFKAMNPSVENIAKMIFQMLKQPLTTDRVKLASIIVWETPKTSAEYSED